MALPYANRLLLLISMTTLWSCATDTGEEYPATKHKQPKPASQHQYNYAIYLENSGSLNGYLTANGDSSFKTNVYNFITALSGIREKKSLNLYDINSILIPVALNADAAQVSDYTARLDAATFRSRSKASGGDQAQSDLLHIFKILLDSTGAGDIGILISDGIFSPGKKQDAQDYLSRQRSSLQLFMAEKLRQQPISTLVLQFYSGFKGLYYYQDNTSLNAAFQDRPYYLVCFGPEPALHSLLRQVQDNPMFKGFRNFLLLTDSTSYQPAARIRNSDCYNYDPDEPMTVSDIRKGGRDDKFRIRLSADLSGLPVSAAYLADRNNYVLSGGYIIDTIYAGSKGAFTHEVVLLSPTLRPGTVSLTLRKQLPAWVMAANLDEDRNKSPEALAGKTFGIRFLLEGMWQAYAAHSQLRDYFTLSISVKE